jgi:hypothetical protein
MWDKRRVLMASLRYKDNLCEVEMYVGREYSLFKLFCNISQELGKGFYVDFTLGKRDIFIVKNNRVVVKASLSGGLIATIQFSKELLDIVRNEIINQKQYERNLKISLTEILSLNTIKIDRELVPNGIDLLKILKDTFGGEVDIDIANGEVYVITNNRITALMKMSENSNDVYIFSNDESKAQKFVKNLKRIHCLAR